MTGAKGLDASRPEGARDMDAVLVSDFSQLDSMLSGTVMSSFAGYLHSSGNMGAGTLFGADGGYIQSVTSEGTTYTYDPVSDTVTVSGTDRSTFDAATDTLVITTTDGRGGMSSWKSGQRVAGSSKVEERSKPG